jgi:hypothetical protein
MMDNMIRYSDDEARLMAHIRENGALTLKQATEVLKQPRFRTIKVLVDLISIGALNIYTTPKQELYGLNPLLVDA